ncbi:hypothetical protein WJ72_24215 [Burkholderia ubonensis]|nr:hypothetical protein WJ72_24215 [Burkholderia ubonensis]
MHVFRAFVERVAGVERNLLATIQAHHNTAVEYIDKGMCIVTMNRIDATRRIVNHDHLHFLSRIFG